MRRRTTKRLNLKRDFKPLSEFRANAAGLIEQVRSSGRPLVLTQRGHSAAVVLDVIEYERLLSEVELLRDVRDAEDQIAAGAVFTKPRGTGEASETAEKLKVVWSRPAIDRVEKESANIAQNKPGAA